MAVRASCKRFGDGSHSYWSTWLARLAAHQPERRLSNPVHRKSVPSEEVTALLAARKQMQITGAITRVDDAAVRTALHDVANAMLTRATKFSALKRWAMNVAKRRGHAEGEGGAGA